MPHERDQAVQPPPRPKDDKVKRAARDQESGRKDTEARWRADAEFSRNAGDTPEKPGPVITRRRYRI
jgi:hypothetical protein